MQGGAGLNQSRIMNRYLNFRDKSMEDLLNMFSVV